MRRVIGSGGLALALLLSGCGGDKAAHDIKSEKEAKALLASAVEATNKADSAKFAATATADGKEIGDAEGAVAFDGSKLAAKADFAGFLDLVPEEDLGMYSDVEPEDLKFELRVLDGKAYVGSPAIKKSGFFGEAWIAYDAEELDEELASIDPDEMVDVLEDAGVEVKVEGSEKVRGAATTHLSAVIDTEALNDALGTEGSDSDTEEFPIDVWIDAEDRIRRIEFTMEVPESEDAPLETFGFRLELFDFGTDFDVEAPDEDDVFDVSEFGRETEEKFEDIGEELDDPEYDEYEYDEYEEDFSYEDEYSYEEEPGYDDEYQYDYEDEYNDYEGRGHKLSEVGSSID